MSIRATEWAYSQEIDGAAAKFVLVALADFADEEGTCFPGQELLATRTGQSPQSVRRHLKWLEEEGFISRIRRFDNRGHRTSDRYQLDLDRAPTSAPSLPVNLTTGQSDHRSICTSLPVNLTIPTGQVDRVTVRGTISEPPEGPGKLPRPRAADKNQRPDILSLCQHLSDRLTENDVKHEITEEWKDQARLILDKDKRDPEQAHRLIDWTTNDEFWPGNVHSMPTFRKQYDKLRMKAWPKSGSDPQNLWDALRERGA